MTPSRVPVRMWMWRAVHLLCAAFSPRGSPVCLWLRVSCAFKCRSQRLLTTRQRPSIALALCDRHQGRSQPATALKPPAHGGSTGMPLLPANAGHLPPHLKSAHKPACLCVPGTPRGPGRRQRPTKSFEPHARSTMIMGPCSARRRPPRRGNPACKSL